LRRRDRDQRELRKPTHDHSQVVQIEPAVHRCHCFVPLRGEEREVQVVGVEVQDVELVRLPPHAVEHYQMIDEWVFDAAVEPQRRVAAGDQLCAGIRVAAREQCHLVAEPNQLLRQVEHHTLGAAVELRRTAFV
jgi:hypothetical protein